MEIIMLRQRSVCNTRPVIVKHSAARSRRLTDVHPMSGAQVESIVAIVADEEGKSPVGRVVLRREPLRPLINNARANIMM